MSRSSADATSGAPWSCATTSTRASVPRRAWPMPCQRGQEARRACRRRPARPPCGGRPATVAGAGGARRVAPLPLDAVGPELAAHHPAVALEHLEGRPDRFGAQAVAGGRVRAARNGTVGARRSGRPGRPPVCGTDSVQASRQADGHRDAEGVAEAAGVLGRAHPFLAGDDAEERAALGDELVDPLLHRGAVDGPQPELVERQRSEQAELVVRLVDVAGQATVDQSLELELEVGQHVGVDELSELLRTEQVAQQIAVERQRRRPALGERSVARVHVHGDPPEHERLRERRRHAGSRRTRDGSCASAGRAAPRRGRARRRRR